MLIDAYQILSGKKMAKGTKDSIYKNGFFFGSGIFSGIILNDLWRILSLPGNESKLITSKNYEPKVTETHMDEVYQYVIVGAVAILSLLSGKYFKEILPLTGGAALGVAWANQAEHTRPISVLPF